MWIKILDSLDHVDLKWQNLKSNWGIRHLHDVGLTELVKLHLHGEHHTVGNGRIYRFIQLGPGYPVGDRPDVRLFRSAGALITELQRFFQRGHHHLQLADVLKIGQRDEPVRLTPGLP